MERRGPKARKTEHKVEEENKDATPELESGNANAERKAPSTMDDTAEKVDDPLNNPRLKGDKAGRKQRKRPASAPVVSPPKKLAPPLEIEPAAAETDKSFVDDVLMLEVENLTIDQSRRDYRLEGAIPRPQPEVFVSRERSGYVIAQASFLVPSRESAPGGSSEGMPGSSGAGVAGGSSEGVAGGSSEGVAVGSGAGVAGGSSEGVAVGSGAGVPSSSGASVPYVHIGDDVPIITIITAEKKYAKIIAKYNGLIPGIEHQITHYRNVLEAIPELIEDTRHSYLVLFFCQENTSELESACSLGCFDLECIQQDLDKYIKEIEKRIIECTTIAKDIMQIHGADNTSPRSILSSEELCRLLKKLENGLEFVSRYVDKCNNEVLRYDELRIELDLRFPGVGSI